MSRRSIPALSLAAAPLLAVPACLAQTDSFHLMQIEQVVGGVNGDTSKQAVQLRMRSFGQEFVAGKQIIAYDAAGLNPVVLLTIPTDVDHFDEGSRILITTPGFPAPVTPDFTMTTPIPASYLAAGRVTFDAFGFTLWSLAWGGSAYAGTNLGTLDNDPDGNFGPAWDGPCPSTGTRGLLFQGPANASSTTNAQDYALTLGAAVLTNNAGQSGAITTGPTPCYANCDGSTQPPAANVADFTCFLQKFAANDPYANCDGSTTPPTVNVGDFTCFLQKFAAGCP